MEIRFQQMMDQMATQWTMYQIGYPMERQNPGPDSNEVSNLQGNRGTASKPKVRHIMEATTPPRNKVMRYDDNKPNTPMEGQSPT
jgi:hypothetical protein